MRLPKLEVFEAKSDWRWRLRGANGEIQCQSEGYTTEGNAKRGAKAARRNMLIARVLSNNL